MEDSEVGGGGKERAEEGEDGKVLWRRQVAATRWRRARSCGTTKLGEEQRHSATRRK
jgi:hypothetical protein